MAKKGPIKENLEYGALRLFCAIVNAIPYEFALKMARGMAKFLAKTLKFKRERTFSRIKSVFPGISDREAADIAERSLANILQTAVEMMRAPYLDKAWMDRYVQDGEAYKKRLQEYVDEGKGVVIMVPHSGNWYMAAWSMAKYGLPLFAIAAKQRNRKIDAWMKRQYGDIEVLERGNQRTLVDIKRKLEEGRAFAILPDLRVPQKDVEADFLGGKANVSHAGAMFAVRCGSPVVVAAMRRENSKHVFAHLATLRPDPEAKDRKGQAEAIMREAMRILDAEIRRNPGDWFWYNKRWILQPVKQ
ncbi:MAG: lysophospholipid acyltransferase family protein [Kiritimatiellae bacterium]|nr:lysophospholipid acyltransferase family protein [Kiritimatiellia bacterium]